MKFDNKFYNYNYDGIIENNLDSSLNFYNHNDSSYNFVINGNIQYDEHDKYIINMENPYTFMENLTRDAIDISNNKISCGFKNKMELTSDFIKKEVSYLTHFSTFSEIINETYIGVKANNSLTLDLISLYLKGQKILYVESKTYCELCLYFIMLPAIFISTVCTVLSISLKTYENGPVIVSGLTALNSFLLAIITYLKLDAKAEAHKTSAYQFDKMQTTCEFLSGKVLLINDNEMVQKVNKFVDEVEKKVEEIKDTNQFIIPEIIRIRYMNIYSINVFSVVKAFRTRFILDKNRLFLTFSEIEKQAPNVDPRLIAIKNKLLEEIIKVRDISIDINNKIYSDVEKYNAHRNIKYSIFMWLKT